MDCINGANILKFGELLSSSTKVAVLTHTHPDGDAIGSVMAMAHYLNDICKLEARAIVPNDYAENLDFIVDHNILLNASNSDEAISWIQSSNLIIVMDLNSPHRADNLENYLKASNAPKILIDHHQNPAISEFDLVFSEVEISSTCELCYYILSKIVDNLPLNIATALFLGMTTDTNNFANSTYPSTLKMASQLIEIGVNRDEILTHLYNEFRENRLRAMGDFLSEKLTLLPCGVAYAIFDKKTLYNFELKEGETESFVNLPLAIKSVNYSIFLKEDEGYFRVSIRSKKGYSAARFARQFFNGGGHENAAGGRLFIPKDISEAAMASHYIETSAARFVQQEQIEQQENE